MPRTPRPSSPRAPPVTAWNDGRGNGFNATGGGGAATGVATINGLNAIQFNGSSNYLVGRGTYAGQMVFVVSARNTSDSSTLQGVNAHQRPVPSNRRIRRTGSASVPTPGTSSATATRMERPPPYGSTALPLPRQLQLRRCWRRSRLDRRPRRHPAGPGRTAVLRQCQRGGKPGNRCRYLQRRRPLFRRPHRRGPDLQYHHDHRPAARRWEGYLDYKWFGIGSTTGNVLPTVSPVQITERTLDLDGEPRPSPRWPTTTAAAGPCSAAAARRQP